MAKLFWLCAVLAAGLHLLGWRQDLRMVERYLRGEEKPQLPAKPPRVSVLTAAWNEKDDLPRLIQSFLRLTYPDRELIICAGGSDGTLALARGFASDSVHVIEQKPGDGQRGGQRRCLAMASGEIVFLTDADCILDDESFTRAVALLCTAEESVVVGPHVPLIDQRQEPLVFYRWCVDSYRRLDRPRYVDAADANGANFAARRQAFTAIGDLSGDAPTGTDYDMATRLLQAGYRMRYVPYSVVQTRYESSAKGYVWQNARWVRSAIVYGFRFGQIKDIRQNVLGSALGLSVIVLPFVRPFAKRIATYLWLLIVMAYWGKRVRYLLLHSRLHRSPLRPALFLQAMAFSFLDFLAWAIALVQALVPRWRRAW